MASSGSCIFFILARFFPYFMYSSSTCSVLDHEVERGYVYWEINVSNVVLNHVVDRQQLPQFTNEDTNELRTGKNLFSNARHFCSSRASGHKNSVVPRYNKSLYDKHLGQTIDFFVPAWNPVFSKHPRKKVVRIIIGRFEQSGLNGGRFKYLTWVVRVTFGSYNQQFPEIDGLRNKCMNNKDTFSIPRHLVRYNIELSL